MFIRDFLIRRRALKKIEAFRNYKNEKKILYLLSPEHGNLGDQAIAIAIRKYLEDTYKEKTIIEFSYKEYTYIKDIISSITNNDDVIFLHGGGNLGNLYINEEILRRDVIGRFINNMIVVMPQSISFTDDENGKYEMEQTKKIYNNHNNLYIVCREKKSYEKAQGLFENNNLIYSPDSVLYLSDYYKESLDRKNVLFALRSDKEKVIDDSRIRRIKDIIRKEGLNIVYRDTIIKRNVTVRRRIFEFNKILRSFGSSKLVITDRFHGVIFSYITRTPCIVFKSLDHKISEGIKWFENVNYIYYAEDADENLEFLIKKFLNYDSSNVEKNNHLKDAFCEALRHVL